MDPGKPSDFGVGDFFYSLVIRAGSGSAETSHGGSHMAKQLEAHNWSANFRELLANEARSLDFQQYEFCLDEWKGAHDKKTITNYLITILLFCAGLWAVYEHAIFMAVLLLALAANFNRQSSHHILVSEIMGAQRLLAMLINKQSRDIEALREERSRSATS